ncbi:Spi family protease inhibitor [Streptococcus didelphis]|uniref:Spi family protease inhibitor n=2 Tax=Streptococcus didelphis TaxID=102886 RepID=A0ABY9LFX7_9STRE|nr:Spi family protease inhibitor [Streptococcus didelphis]WMB27822.1 Spi family protease inhibitor [Streptococcus didelphis]
MDFVRTEKQAHTIAKKFCEEQSQSSIDVDKLIYPLVGDNADGELYIYALFPAGFIIVSGDTRAYTILGYSFDNNLDLKKESVRDMVESYQEQIKTID